MRALLSILLMIIVLVSNSNAEELTFDLKGITGAYPYLDNSNHELWVRSDTFTYSGPDVLIKTVRIYLEGIAGEGLIACCNTHCDTLDWPGFISTELIKLNAPGIYSTNLESVESPLSVICNLHRSYLYPFYVLRAGDQFTVRQQYIYFDYDHGCKPLTERPAGYLTSAILEFTVEEPGDGYIITWGGIKAIYGP